MVKADGLIYMAMFILNYFMVKAHGFFEVVIGTCLLYMVILYGLFKWLQLMEYYFM